MVQSYASWDELIIQTYANLEAQDRWSTPLTDQESHIALQATRGEGYETATEPSQRAANAIVLERAWRLPGINPFERATAISNRMTDSIHVLATESNISINADMHTAWVQSRIEMPYAPPDESSQEAVAMILKWVLHTLITPPTALPDGEIPPVFTPEEFHRQATESQAQS